MCHKKLRQYRETLARTNSLANNVQDVFMHLSDPAVLAKARRPTCTCYKALGHTSRAWPEQVKTTSKEDGAILQTFFID